MEPVWTCGFGAASWGDSAAAGVDSWAIFGSLRSAPRVRIFSDASGDVGFGGTAQGLVVAGTWAAEARGPDGPSIAVKELIPVYFLLRELAPSLQAGTVVIITTDNKSNAFSLNKGTTCAASIEHLRLICQLAFQHRLRLVGDWIPRESNVLCDLLLDSLLSLVTSASIIPSATARGIPGGAARNHAQSGA